jgi:hypothetical protein
MSRRFRVALITGMTVAVLLVASLVLVIHGSLTASATGGNGASQGISAVPTPPAPVLPMLAPPSGNYVAQDNPVVTAPDARPVAQLRERPSGLSRSMSVDFPANKADTSGTYSVQVLSSIQYSGAAGSILVTTARPSDTAVQQGFSLGERQITLLSGIVASASDGLGGPYPNRIVWQQSVLLITIAGTLPVESLQELAVLVIVGQ